MKTKEQIKLVLPADLRFSNTVRHLVGDLLLVIEVQELWINRLTLVMDELFMNAVKYGSTDNSDNVFLTVDFMEDEIIFSVEDMGTKTKVDPESLQKMILKSKEDTSLAKTSGRGLAMIVTNWTNDFQVTKSDKGGLKVTAKKHLAEIVEKAKNVSQVNLGQDTDIAVISFNKKLDEHNSDVEKEMIKSTEGMSQTMYVFDLQELNYVNSVFIGLLAKLYNIIAKKNGKVVIINLSDTIKDTLKLVGLTDIIPVVSTMDEAKQVLFAHT